MPRSQQTLRRTRRPTRVAAARVPETDIARRAAVGATAALLALLAMLLTASRAVAAQSSDLSSRSVARATIDATAEDVATDLDARPSPHLSPDDVVAIVVAALGRNDRPVKDYGVSVTFAFSSPANRAFVGPVERFASLVHEKTYSPLLNNRGAARGVARVIGDRATMRVVVTTAAGQRVAYLFTLSLQGDGAYRGCWMTDGVTREPPSGLAAMQVAMAR